MAYRNSMDLASKGNMRDALSKSFEEAAANPQLGHGILNKLHN